MDVQFKELRDLILGMREHLDGRLGQIDGRLGQIDVRLGQIEVRLDQMDERDRLLRDYIDERFTQIHDYVDERTRDMETRMLKGFQKWPPASSWLSGRCRFGWEVSKSVYPCLRNVGETSVTRVSSLSFSDPLKYKEPSFGRAFTFRDYREDAWEVPSFDATMEKVTSPVSESRRGTPGGS